MPKFKVYIETRFSKTLHCLEVLLGDDENVDDGLLKMIDQFVMHLVFTRQNNRRIPVDFICSKGAFNKFEYLQSFLVHGVIGDFDDSIFGDCRRLKHMYLGASIADMFDMPSPCLFAMPLQELVLNGYGLVKVGSYLERAIENIKLNGGKVTFYY